MHRIIYAVITVLLFASCKKEGLKPLTAASLNIINAIDGSSSLTANINNDLRTYLSPFNVYYGGSGLFTVPGGNTSVVLRDQSDTTTTIFNQQFNLPAATIHSLFLTGTLSSVESFLVTDTLPYHGNQGHGVTDSVFSIRFVNLSTGSSPISVNISGNPSGSEVASLAYKGITHFNNYTATAGIDSYTFEFRDQATNTLLTTYTLTGVNDGINGNGYPNNVLFKNFTVALIGPPGSQTVMLGNNIFYF